MVSLPNLDGTFNPPGGGGNPSGGGTPPSAGTAPINLANLPVTGGLTGTTAALLIPGLDAKSLKSFFYVIDPTNFNTEDVVEYDYKIEELEPGNQGTVHNILIRYRDLGPVSFIVAVVSATLPNITNSNSLLVSVGNVTPTFKIFTLKVDLKVTTEAPQVKIIRNAFAGPLSITKVRALISYGDGDVF